MWVSHRGQRVVESRRRLSVRFTGEGEVVTQQGRGGRGAERAGGELVRGDVAEKVHLHLARGVAGDPSAAPHLTHHHITYSAAGGGGRPRHTPYDHR